jgi:hypothetical protein
MMRSGLAGADLATILEAAVTEKLERLEARRYAQVKAPRKALRDTRIAPASRHVPAAVRRAVLERNGRRCSYVDERVAGVRRRTGWSSPIPVRSRRRSQSWQPRSRVPGAQCVPGRARLRSGTQGPLPRLPVRASAQGRGDHPDPDGSEGLRARDTVPMTVCVLPCACCRVRAAVCCCLCLSDPRDRAVMPPSRPAGRGQRPPTTASFAGRRLPMGR